VLVENISAGERVLDYGCGSGILAIVAAKLGAREVVGIDLDQQALHTARANSEANSVSARYTVPAALPPGTFDVVLANILANPLLLLAPALIARVRKGGALVLSGVLARQADEMIAAYATGVPALSLALWRRNDDWVCLARATPRLGSPPPIADKSSWRSRLVVPIARCCSACRGSVEAARRPGALWFLPARVRRHRQPGLC